jgi:hypothetical protein
MSLGLGIGIHHGHDPARPRHDPAAEVDGLDAHGVRIHRGILAASRMARAMLAARSSAGKAETPRTRNNSSPSRVTGGGGGSLGRCLLRAQTGHGDNGQH